MANQRGRDAETGKFIPVAEAKKHKKTAVVENIKPALKKPAAKPAPTKS